MIDCHILTDDWRPETLPVDPTVVYHHAKPIDGDLFRARVNGFALGGNPFVSFMDPGDTVMRGAFGDLLPLAQEHGAVSGNSVVVGVSGNGALLRNHNAEWSLNYHRSSPLHVHQLILVRRSVMQEAIQAAEQAPDHLKNVSPNQLVFAHIAVICGWVFSNHVGYVWFDRLDGFHRRIAPEQRRELKHYINSQILGS